MPVTEQVVHPWVKDSPNNEVPTDPTNGSLQAVPDANSVWKKATSFTANLFYKGYGKRADGVSYFEWRDSDGTMYPMFMIDMDHLLTTSSVNKGAAAASRWKFVKRGVNYGIAIA